jgi:hypothetical protein
MMSTSVFASGRAPVVEPVGTVQVGEGDNSTGVATGVESKPNSNNNVRTMRLPDWVKGD